ncbi:hypothetical protein [Thalassobacillus hwangdonensis]|uniref:YhfH family protein n=1 Tax=Thalassobacillus hwangdonensis TaxID=546108 RepID=A0ABW3L1Q0_9BACI
MQRPENELFGQSGNPNDFGKCSNCGKFLQSKREKKVMLCSECQEARDQAQYNKE